MDKKDGRPIDYLTPTAPEMTTGSRAREPWEYRTPANIKHFPARYPGEEQLFIGREVQQRGFETYAGDVTTET